MSDLIRREDAIAEVSKEFKNSIIGTHCAVNAIYRVPSAQPESSEVARDIATIIENEMDMRVIAQTERKKGKWMRHPNYKDKYFREWDVCSVCGTGCHRRSYEIINGNEFETIYGFSYCPNCGARMVRGEEDEVD